MTPEQSKLLQQLMDGHRKAWIFRERRYAYKEVGRHSGVDPRTVRALEDAGLVVEYPVLNWHDDNWYVPTGELLAMPKMLTLSRHQVVNRCRSFSQ